MVLIALQNTEKTHLILEVGAVPARRLPIMIQRLRGASWSRGDQIANACTRIPKETVIMKRFLSTALILGVCSPFGLLGCAEESKTTKEVEVSSPGGTSTTTQESKVEKQGENPPPISPGTGEPAPAPK
jgi:hypothetical protein